MANVSSRILLVAAALTGCGLPRSVRLDPLPFNTDRVTAQIRTRVKAAGGENAALRSFYVRRQYRAVWSDERGPTRLADHLVEALQRADREGLRSEDYELAGIEAALAALREPDAATITPDRLAKLDLLLTDAFLAYGSHLLAGRVRPDLRPEGLAHRRSPDMAAALQAALESEDIAGTLDTLSPRHDGYRRLRDALARYRAVAAEGGWTAIPDGPILHRGDRGPRVALLRQRLRVEDDRGISRDDDVFDEDVERALKSFQRRHGLTPDGTMGTATRTALNVPIERRIAQMELNLERWRWLPQDLGRRHILVNIAAFELQVVDGRDVVLAMRVVVGDPDNRTPLLTDTIQYLVLNPYWHVPRDIAADEFLPKVRENVSYLAQQRLRVFTDSGSDAREVDPATVDWSAFTSSDFPFVLRQDPGAFNSLGRVKFMFPNPFSVYLHDTPARGLFNEVERDLSHGCIRVEQPVELAEYLLRQTGRWNRAALLRGLDDAVDLEVQLPEPLPVHLHYWTAWADENGTVQFRRDIYGYDAPLLTALRAPPATTE